MSSDVLFISLCASNDLIPGYALRVCTVMHSGMIKSFMHSSFHKLRVRIQERYLNEHQIKFRYQTAIGVIKGRKLPWFCKKSSKEGSELDKKRVKEKSEAKGLFVKCQLTPTPCCCRRIESFTTYSLE